MIHKFTFLVFIIKRFDFFESFVMFVQSGLSLFLFFLLFFMQQFFFGLYVLRDYLMYTFQISQVDAVYSEGVHPIIFKWIRQFWVA